MNAAEHFFCSSSLWRHLTSRKLLPWILGGASLGDHLLEIGAGYGPATGHLQTRVRRITSLDYDHNSSLQLKSQNNVGAIAAVQGDASQLPFACETFSSALAILVLHHLRSTELQDQMFVEAFRVLRPGGVFIGFEIPDNWLHRAGHIRSTFTPMVPSSAFPRLNAAGFSKISLDVRRGGFRFTATRPTADGREQCTGLS
ncbi:MAG: class I SAM-dependent methyltransferase [Candidatus Acidiferrum sp.]|jgi:ubiquinone/menaquinone biosynthesis C-methylase UbiE